MNDAGLPRLPDSPALCRNAWNGLNRERMKGLESSTSGRSGTKQVLTPSQLRPRACTVVVMEDADRDVLEFIGDQGKTAEQLADRFPAFELERLVRAELVRPRRTEPPRSQSRRAPAAPDPTFYVLTARGAEAIGLDAHTLHSD